MKGRYHFFMMTLPLSEQALSLKANHLRLTALEMIYRAGSGHPAPAFSIAEIIATLYYHVLHIRPADPLWPYRDRLILSKGHACSILYAALADRGFFASSDLLHFRELGSHLQGHPKLGTPGIDASTGALGLGASIATGMAFAGKKQNFSVYAILSDGEMNVGLVWETALFAAHNSLANLTFIVDRNTLQYTGPTEKVLAIEPLAEKWSAFGWEVLQVDGHNAHELLEAFNTPRTAFPRVMIARTIKGKGVSFMENSLKWHGTAPSLEEYQAARAELLAKE
jgi:transketolase